MTRQSPHSFTSLETPDIFDLLQNKNDERRKLAATADPGYQQEIAMLECSLVDPSIVLSEIAWENTNARLRHLYKIADLQYQYGE